MKIYFFKFTVWRQGKAGWYEMQELKKLAGEKMAALQQPDQFDIASFVNKATDDGTFVRFYAILLKPMYGFKRWNAWLMRKRGLEGGDVAKLMAVEDYANVAGFFLVKNFRWISTLLTFTVPWLSSTKTIPLMGKKFQLKNPLYVSQAETSNGPEGS